MNKNKLIFTAGLGTLFESFEFYLFSLFAIALNHSFFGSINQHSVLWIFLIFAIGYLARIVGALIFGYWGDKIGRLYSFKKTVIIMALSSIAMGLIPTYASIGILAIVLLMTFRFVQGLSYGGELSGATIVIIEKYKKNQPILILFVCLMISVGIFLAKITYALLGVLLSYQHMSDYGWRIAYICAGLLMFHSYFARQSFAEAHDFQLMKSKTTYKNTIVQMFAQYKSILFLGVLCLIGVQTFWSVFLIYLPTYSVLTYHSSQITSNIYYIIIFGKIIGAILGALIANKTNIKSVYSISSIFCILLTIPLYITLKNFNLNNFYYLLSLITIIDSTASVLCMLQLAKRFPIKYRYTLTATANALSAFFFIGLPPFLFSYFTREESMFYPMLVFGIACMIQFLSVQIFYKKTEQFI